MVMARNTASASTCGHKNTTQVSQPLGRAGPAAWSEGWRRYLLGTAQDVPLWACDPQLQQPLLLLGGRGERREQSVLGTDRWSTMGHLVLPAGAAQEPLEAAGMGTEM